MISYICITSSVIKWGSIQERYEYVNKSDVERVWGACFLKAGMFEKLVHDLAKVS